MSTKSVERSLIPPGTYEDDEDEANDADTSANTTTVTVTHGHRSRSTPSWAAVSTPQNDKSMALIDASSMVMMTPKAAHDTLGDLGPEPEPRSTPRAKNNKVMDAPHCWLQPSMATTTL